MTYISIGDIMSYENGGYDDDDVQVGDINWENVEGFPKAEKITKRRRRSNGDTVEGRDENVAYNDPFYVNLDFDVSYPDINVGLDFSDMYF